MAPWGLPCPLGLREIFPVCERASAILSFWGLRRKNHFSISSPSWQSSALVSSHCGRKCCSFCERCGSHEPNQGSRHVGHLSCRVPLNAKYPCPVLWGNPPPPVYAPSVMSGGRKCLPKMAFCCLLRCLPGKSSHLYFAAWLKPTGMDGHSHKTPYTSRVRGAIPTAVVLFRSVGLLFVKRRGPQQMLCSTSWLDPDALMFQRW